MHTDASRDASWVGRGRSAPGMICARFPERDLGDLSSVVRHRISRRVPPTTLQSGEAGDWYFRSAAATQAEIPTLVPPRRYRRGGYTYASKRAN